MNNGFKNLIIVIITILFLCAEQSGIQAADIFVTPDTSAPAGNGEQDSPYNTISVALSAASPGDVVKLMDGVYNTTISFPHGGTVGHPIVLTYASSPKSAIIDCNNANLNCITADYGNITIDGLEVRNVNYSGIKVDGDHHGFYDPRTSYGSWGNYGERHIHTNGADNVIIKGNYIHNIGYDCIKIGHVNNIQVIDNDISQCGLNGQQQGIDMVGVYDSIIKNNFIHDDGEIRSMELGIMVKGGSENVMIENNIIENIVSPFAALEIGGDTEWYNTRYTPANFDYDLNSVLLTQTNSDNNIDNSGTYVHQYMAEIRNSVVRGNLIVNADPGISFRNAYNMKVYNNTVINSGWSQAWVKIWCDGNHNHTTSHINMHNNLFYNDSLALASKGVFYDKHVGTIYASNMDGFVSDNNLFWSMGAAPSLGVSGNNANSLFVNPLLNDSYELLHNSPAIDAGVNLFSLGIVIGNFVDRTGTNRPSGSGFDIGAYEYKSVAESVPSPPSNVRAVKPL